MKEIIIKEKFDYPLDKVWEMFVDLENFPKYFKYVNKVFYNEKMSLGSVWYDFASFVVPIIVKHKTTVFEKEKTLGFEVYIPFRGFVKERVNFTQKGDSTEIDGNLVFDFGNPIFSFLFDKLFEKRMKESIDGAISKFKRENSA